MRIDLKHPVPKDLAPVRIKLLDRSVINVMV